MTNLPATTVWKSRLCISAHLVFDTGWRIGSGREGLTSDLGVLLDAAGQPLLPGSSLKGKLRATCEVLAPALGLKACLLDHEASKVPCASDVRWYQEHRKAYRQVLREGVQEQLAWIAEHTCDVCGLFGSPVRASRLRVSDGLLTEPHAAVVLVRDGVVLDRDSHTAAEGLKYDYETVAAGTSFLFAIDVEDPTPADEALLGAALFEWAAGSSLGGFTSRGLGRFHLEKITLRGVRLDDPRERGRFLTRIRPEEKLTDRGDWQAYFQSRIEDQLGRVPATH